MTDLNLALADVESYAATVRRIAGPAFAGFFIVCLPSSLVACSILSGDPFPPMPGQFGELLLAVLIVCLFAFVIGFFAVLLYGIPTYAVLAKLGWANYFTATLIGALPAAPFALVEWHVSELTLALYSVGTAVVTHYLVERANRPTAAR